MLTKKLNEIADSKGAATYIRARSPMASLARKLGYEVLERYEVNLAEYGGEGEWVGWAMKREPGAKSDESATLP